MGIKVGEGAAPAAGAASTTTAPAAGGAAQPVVSAPVNTQIDLNDPNVVDYTKTYNAVVLGQKPIDWGNSILIGLIGLVIVGGGGLVVTHEKLVKVSFGDTKKVEGEYSSDVVDMLPSIANLKSNSRKSLKNVLDNPQKAEKILGLMDAVASDEKTEE